MNVLSQAIGKSTPTRHTELVGESVKRSSSGADGGGVAGNCAGAKGGAGLEGLKARCSSSIWNMSAPSCVGRSGTRLPDITLEPVIHVNVHVLAQVL